MSTLTTQNDYYRIYAGNRNFGLNKIDPNFESTPEVDYKMSTKIELKRNPPQSMRIRSIYVQKEFLIAYAYVISFFVIAIGRGGKFWQRSTKQGIEASNET